MKKRYKVLLSIAVALIVWYMLYLIINVDLIFPIPHHVLIEVFNKLTNIKSVVIIANTMIKLSILVIMTLIAAYALAYIAYKNETVEIILKPYVNVFKTTPVVAILVIVLMLVGIKKSADIIVILVVFPISYQALFDHNRAIDYEYSYLLKLEKTTHFRSIKKIFLPLSINKMLTILMQTTGLGLKVLVMSEYISQTPNSIGKELYMNRIDLNYLSVYAWALILVIISILIDVAVKKVKIKH